MLSQRETSEAARKLRVPASTARSKHAALSAKTKSNRAKLWRNAR